MAQINIEKKKSPIWPWILGLILLALIAWAIYEFAYEPNQTGKLPILDNDGGLALLNLLVPSVSLPLQSYC